MENNIYILAYCDSHKLWSTMRLIGATTDKSMLYAMILNKIECCEMEYGDGEEKSLECFLEDFKNDTVDLDKLSRGFVFHYNDLQISNNISLEQFPGAQDSYYTLFDIKGRAEIDKLGLDNRSFTYSLVEIRTDFGYGAVIVPGICNKEVLENNKEYQQLMKEASDSNVNINFYAYHVGHGKIVPPDENDLKVISMYQDMLDTEDGIEPILSDFFSFYYEAEQEQ